MKYIQYCFLALCVVFLWQGCGDLDAGHELSALRTLRGSSTRIRGFDPVKAGDVATALAAGKVYEGLYAYDYKARPYRLVPALAAGMPEVSADGLVYTISLRRGVHFQNDACFGGDGGGREVTASDFVFSIKRVADVKTGSSGFWIFRNRIVGLDEFRRLSGGDGATDYSVPVEGLRVVDEYTIEIRLKEKYPQLLWILAMPYGYVVPREAVDYYGSRFVEHPVGSGPFLLKEWRRNYRFEYLRNTNYCGWNDEAVGNVERIVQSVIDDSSTRWLAFLNGQLDLYADIARDNWDVIFSEGMQLNAMLRQRGITLHAIAGLNVYYIGFNMDDPVLGQNRALRQALTCAFNSREWVDYYNGRITRAYCPVPPGVSGHVGDEIPFRYDLDRARTLLVDAGYPEGIDPSTGRRLVLTLELGKTDSDMRESTELFCDFMREIGVVIEASYNNKPAFFEKIERRKAQMFRLSWFADYPDGQNFLQLFYSKNASPGPNRVNYHNAAFDQLYEQAAVMQDSPERTVLYRRLARMVMEDCPWLIMHYPVDYSLTREWLENYLPSDFPYGMEKYYFVKDPSGNRNSL